MAVCDTVHVLALERIERSVLADRQVVMTALAGGAKDLALPSVQDAWDEYEAALVADPVTVVSEQSELLQALGL